MEEYLRKRRCRMKKIYLATIITLFAYFVSAEITVTNLVVAQRPGTKLVDITYDVYSAETSAVVVSLAVSNGINTVSATNLLGDVGADIATGTGKSIVWDIGADWSGNVSTLSFSITANDGRASVAKTGQSTLYRAGDDGNLKTGITWPDPRFADQGDGTVADNLTGLEWVKAPHSLSGNSGTTNWNSAIDFCRGLVYANHSDWRLPSRKELMSLADYGRSSPALPAGHPFSGVRSNYGYWSSTRYASNTNSAWYVAMGFGSMDVTPVTAILDVWPVRGGQ